MSEPPGNAGAVVRGPVIDHDDLVRLTGLFQQGPNGLSNEYFPIIAGNDNGYEHESVPGFILR